MHHLTGRLSGSGYDFENRHRTAEIAVGGPEAFLIGVPPPDLLAVFDAAVDRSGRSDRSVPSGRSTPSDRSVRPDRSGRFPGPGIS
ncbi:hypothetical protein ACSNOH_00480 [Streptomyces sp. URMC 127]|uniref:hypothetical protein n=1 Tax=Streptomyces sp. URMC 127 TaxID=3423402 RepID=UPI003F1973C8